MLGYLLRSLASGSVPTTSHNEPPLAKDFALEDRVDALELACAGLWELLKSKNGYTDGELASLITELDARDGSLDNRIAPPIGEVCPQCGRRLLTRRRDVCVWCGAKLTGRVF